MDARGRLLGDAFNVLGDAYETLGVACDLAVEQVEDHPPLFRIVGRIELGDVPFALELHSLVHEQRGVAAVIDNERRAAAVRPHERLGRAPPIFFESLPFPREHRNAARIRRSAAGLGTSHHYGGGGVVLCRKNIARHPADVGAEDVQRFDQHRGLNRHVQRAHDLRAGERFGVRIFLAHGHEARHFVLGQANLGPPPSGERRR